MVCGGIVEGTASEKFDRLGVEEERHEGQPVLRVDTDDLSE
jgi:hypothetical protein